MTPQTKKHASTRLRRVAGQIEGIQRMVEEDRYCVDVLHQISAARAALAKVSKLLLESHINTCVRSAFDSDDHRDREAKVEELLGIFDNNCNC